MKWNVEAKCDTVLPMWDNRLNEIEMLDRKSEWTSVVRCDTVIREERVLLGWNCQYNRYYDWAGRVWCHYLMEEEWVVLWYEMSVWGTMRTDWKCKCRYFDPGVTGLVLLWCIGVRENGNVARFWALKLWSRHMGRWLDAMFLCRRQGERNGDVRFVTVVNA